MMMADPRPKPSDCDVRDEKHRTQLKGFGRGTKADYKKFVIRVGLMMFG